MALPGISTLGIEFGFGMETVAGTKPTAFTRLTRINSIGGISLPSEQIDASALEDFVTRYIAGRQDTGGEWTVVVNVTDDTIAEWKDCIDTYYNRTDLSLSMWWVVWSPELTDAFYVVAQPPRELPMSELGQNELQTIEITLSINEYKGMDTAIRPTSPNP